MEPSQLLLMPRDGGFLSLGRAAYRVLDLLWADEGVSGDRRPDPHEHLMDKLDRRCEHEAADLDAELLHHIDA